MPSSQGTIDGGRRIRAAVLASRDPLNGRSWSGTSRSIFDALDREFDLVHVEQSSFPPALQTLNRAVSKLTRGALVLEWRPAFVRYAFGAARERIRAADPEVLFVIAAAPLAYVAAEDWRVITIDDATGPGLLEYYPELRNMPRQHKRFVHDISVRAIKATMLSLYPSSWARASAIKDAGKAPEDAVEIAWGHNMRSPPAGRVRTLGTPGRLIFVGVDWARKGGGLLVEAVRLLQAEGIAVELDVVGCERPAGEPAADSVRFHGLLDKTKPDEAALLDRLFDEAHVLVVPSQAECYGMVFAEASAYGLPSVSVRTGGIPSVVLDGKTGILIEPGAPAAALADAIRSLVTDPQRYNALSRNALEDSRERLNWNVWAQRVRKLVEQRLGRR